MIEAVCCSPDDCVEAAAAGADRIELCAALALGGLTPSVGTFLEARRRIELPIVCMVRPRTGGFCYLDGEFAGMERDAASFASHGADGIVFGVLTRKWEVDPDRCRTLVEAARPGHAVFHRAFDTIADPRRGLEALVELGVTRILTSGRQRTALDGAALIRALIEQAAGRIEILPGGGIRASNVDEILRATGARSVHLAPFTLRDDRSGQSNPDLSFGAGAPPEGRYPVVDGEALRAVRAALAALDRGD